MPFISFSNLIALARISSTMMNSSVECGYPYLTPDLGRKLSAFYQDVSCRFFLSIMLRKLKESEFLKCYL